MNAHLDRKHQYKENFLTDVILRVDFKKIDYSPEILETIKKAFSDTFPVLQQMQGKNITFTIKDNSSVTEESQSTVYKLVDKDIKSKKIFEFDNMHFAYTEQEYISHGAFEGIVLRIIKFFEENYKDIIINRVGLRYVNQIYLNEKNPYNLDGYINDKLSSILNFNPQNKIILRSMNSTEYKIDDDTRLILKYGMYNKNYPAEPINKEFILDLDCYSNIIENLGEVNNFMSKNNKLMAIYFEASIEEKLRKEALHETDGE